MKVINTSSAESTLMKQIKALRAALNGNGRYRYKAPESVVDFLVVGGGVVGLAIAQRLSCKFPRHSTVLVERHMHAGEEISSRNSEVIHSGLYYPPHSLKTRLCLRGRDLLYERCRTHNIHYLKCGKLVVARREQLLYMLDLHRKSLALLWPMHSPLYDSSLVANPNDAYCAQTHPRELVLPTEVLSGDAARDMEPNLSQDIIGALWCPMTGIVDSHGLIQSLEKEVVDSEGGDLVYGTKVVRVDRYKAPSVGSGNNKRKEGWVVQTVTGDNKDREADAILARTLINASGLSSALVLNAILKEEERIPMYYARGSYASYHGPGIEHVTHLIYPCPEVKTGDAHAFHSLGTHLTLDLQGKIKFGPDLEWVEPPSEDNPDDAEFWVKHLIPDEGRMGEMHEAVMRYLPGVQFEGMQPDYCGMRPKLVPPGGGFHDFTFRRDYADVTRGGGLMLSLLGIESPGLTSSLAIAEHVVEDVLKAEYGTEK